MEEKDADNIPESMKKAAVELLGVVIIVAAVIIIVLTVLFFAGRLIKKKRKAKEEIIPADPGELEDDGKRSKIGITAEDIWNNIEKPDDPREDD